MGQAEGRTAGSEFRLDAVFPFTQDRVNAELRTSRNNFGVSHFRLSEHIAAAGV
jgi:hypothetical protein